MNYQWVSPYTYSFNVLQLLREVLHSILDFGQQFGIVGCLLFALTALLLGITKVGLKLFKHALTTVYVHKS